MTAKKLNTTSIVNELKGQSGFFPQPQASEPKASQIIRTDGTTQRTAQPSDRTPAKPIPKRDTKRHPFEIYRDQHSERFYQLVASRVPEAELRRMLSEIKADGARQPERVFTYKVKKYAMERARKRIGQAD